MNTLKKMREYFELLLVLCIFLTMVAIFGVGAATVVGWMVAA